jgi:hypothetical protein
MPQKLLLPHKSTSFNYWFSGGLGCSLIGAGVCICIEAAFIKHGGISSSWIIAGILGLCSINAGISFLIIASKFSND